MSLKYNPKNGSHLCAASCFLLRLLINIVGLEFGVHDLLAPVEAMVARQHIAQGDGQQEVGHSLQPEELEAD